MSDNRPTQGYVIIDIQKGPQSWSNEEGRLYTSTCCEVFPTKAMANHALNATLEFADRQGWNWKDHDYEVHRCVRPRTPRAYP